MDSNSTGPLGITTIFVLKRRREIRRQIRVHIHNLGDVPIEFLNQRHILHHVIRALGLVILVHLLDEGSVPVKNRLHQLETFFEIRPDFVENQCDFSCDWCQDFIVRIRKFKDAKGLTMEE